MKKIIYSDIDGTLFSSGPKSLKNETIKAIENAQKESIEFIMSTATSYFDGMKELTKKLNSNYLIASSGAQIIDIKNGKMLFEAFLDNDLTKEVRDYINDKHLVFVGWNNDFVFVNTLENEWLNNFLIERVDRNLKAKIWQDGDKVHKIWAFGKSPQAIDEFQEWLTKKELSVTRTGELYVDITPKGINKGSGVEFMTKHLGADLKDVMSIGDTIADVAMFEKTGYSYSMDNADRNTKDKSKFHTSDVSQNGLAMAIDDYMFRTKEVR